MATKKIYGRLKQNKKDMPPCNFWV